MEGNEDAAGFCKECKKLVTIFFHLNYLTRRKNGRFLVINIRS